LMAASHAASISAIHVWMARHMQVNWCACGEEGQQKESQEFFVNLQIIIAVAVIS